MDTSAATTEIIAKQVVIIAINCSYLPSNFRLYFSTALYYCGAFPGHAVRTHLFVRGVFAVCKLSLCIGCYYLCIYTVPGITWLKPCHISAK